ncbi:MAG TPA: hypothetical protein VJH03_07925 [Blastocatellia bacterium]|nr:hypothetical protein [Blastocatellia bacterium]
MIESRLPAEVKGFASRGALRTCPLIAMLLLLPAAGYVAAQSSDYGPEVKSFLEFLRHEETELEYQIKHDEISKKEYIRSKTRISILRDTVVRIVKRTGEDNVPELHVVAAPELDQLIENGTKAVGGLKPGSVIGGKWRYLETVTRGEVFYVFERLTK